ncbi:MAG TPA: FAD-dependent oxidoreductase [Candidatus Cryosericum sp.]|nr:FAD-dependent oxidoreductase [Candidatus Cryosericum sp.]
MHRRDFIKIVVSGSLVSLACPRGRDSSRGAIAPASAPASGPSPALSTEENAACHAVRDGTEFRLPRPSRHVAIAIVGAGPAGLAAARALGDRPYVLIEKEAQVGGNATGGSWRGVGYSSGTSYSNDADLMALAAEMGVPLLPIDSVDGLIVRDIYVPEFFTRGVTRAPYPQHVRDAFRRFVDTYRHYDADAEIERLDNLPFADILKDYPREISDFFDSFGPNNWGARVQDTSAYIGIGAASWMGGLEPRRYTGEAGFGSLTRALGTDVVKGGADRLLTGAVVVRVQPDGGRVLVAYAPQGAAGDLSALECVSADTVVVAAPKLIARRIVAGLPPDQQAAMAAIRYAPYMVANFCFDGVVHDGCFDTNVPAPDAMSDFVCADWTKRRGSGPRDRPTVLTCYMPQKEEDRVLLLDEDEARRMALQALARLDRWFPGAADKCREIQVRLRGHPMYLSTCGMLTRTAPLARRSLGAVHFAGTDGVGGVSEYATALSSGREAAGLALAALDAAARRRG